MPRYWLKVLHLHTTFVPKLIQRRKQRNCGQLQSRHSTTTVLHEIIISPPWHARGCGCLASPCCLLACYCHTTPNSQLTNTNTSIQYTSIIIIACSFIVAWRVVVAVTPTEKRTGPWAISHVLPAASFKALQIVGFSDCGVLAMYPEE